MITKLYENNPNERDINKVVELLRDGGVIIFPTDTVYAIGCDALNAKAVERVCQIKGLNPAKAQLSIICYDLSNISEYAKISNDTFKIMKRNLPGPFTFILNITSNLPKLYKNRKTIGIRVPDNNIIRTLVRELGNPIMTTSVKDDDEIVEYTTDPDLIHDRYEKQVDLVIDGGFGGIDGSTVVDCSGDDIEIVRQGKGELVF